MENLSKSQLHELADGILLGTSCSIDASVDFVLAETKGNWHGRARAMICRRLKHATLSPDQKTRLVTCILGRLNEGNFSEQFRDQLRLALTLNREAAIDAARSNLSSTRKDYVRRYSAWILARITA